MTLTEFCNQQDLVRPYAIAPFAEMDWQFVALPDQAARFSVIEEWLEQQGLRFVQNQSVEDDADPTVVTAIRTTRLPRGRFTIWMFRDAVDAVHFKLRFG